jgi:two-component system chemotaxis sensor kinase CheA
LGTFSGQLPHAEATLPRSAMSPAVRVTADGLRALAGRCQTLAGRLTSNTAPTSAVASDQASAAAVGSCDRRIAAAGAALAAWTSATAGTLTTAASAYERQDSESAGELDTTVI